MMKKFEEMKKQEKETCGMVSYYDKKIAEFGKKEREIAELRPETIPERQYLKRLLLEITDTRQMYERYKFQNTMNCEILQRLLLKEDSSH